MVFPDQLQPPEEPFPNRFELLQNLRDSVGTLDTDSYRYFLFHDNISFQHSMKWNVSLTGNHILDTNLRMASDTSFDSAIHAEVMDAEVRYAMRAKTIDEAIAAADVQIMDRLPVINFIGGQEDIDKPEVLHGYIAKSSLYSMYRSLAYSIQLVRAAAGYDEAIVNHMQETKIPLCDITTFFKGISDGNIVLDPRFEEKSISGMEFIILLEMIRNANKYRIKNPLSPELGIISITAGRKDKITVQNYTSRRLTKKMFELSERGQHEIGGYGFGLARLQAFAATIGKKVSDASRRQPQVGLYSVSFSF